MRNPRSAPFLWIALAYWLLLMLGPPAARGQLLRPRTPSTRPVLVKVCWLGRTYYLQQQQQSAPPVIINNPPASPNIVVQLDPAIGAALNRLADSQQQLVAIRYAELALRQTIPGTPGQPVVVTPAPPVVAPIGPNPLQPLLIHTPPAPIVVPPPPPPIVIPPAPPGIVIPPAPAPIPVPVAPGTPPGSPAPIIIPGTPAPITVPGAPPPITVPAPPGMNPIGPMPARTTRPTVVYVQRYAVQQR